MEKVDILAIGAHPDDVELGASGSILKHIDLGYKVAVLDLTKGELGTRGSAELRSKEAQRSSEIMGLSARHQLDLGDGFFEESEENIKQVIVQIRRFQPNIVLCNSINDRHPDHGRGSNLASRACFLSGLSKVKTSWKDNPQVEWRPRSVYHYIQDQYIHPDFLVDISPYWAERVKSIMAYSSQFYNPNSKEKESPISGKEFLDFLEGRALNFGRQLGVKYAEGFTVERPPGIDDLLKIK